MSDVDCLVYLEVSMWYIATLSSVPQQEIFFCQEGEPGNVWHAADCAVCVIGKWHKM